VDQDPTEEKLEESYKEQGIPTPIVKIDNKSDNFATVVSLEFGNALGELLDTMRSLKNLGLNIRRAKIRPGDSGKLHKFYITDSHTAEKITKSARLEEIRMTILQNLLYYHPESATELGFGPKAAQAPSRDSLHPLGLRARSEVKTSIKVKPGPEGAYTEVTIKTTDRPGLLTDIVHNMKDININVISAEVDTEGPVAIDQFYVTYHGEPLPEQMILLLRNSLQYQLSMAEVAKEESY
jgi:UTP:GlnB (protein PII) uridylyltransferase